jgi:hypothetical protein
MVPQPQGSGISKDVDKGTFMTKIDIDTEP